MTTRNDVITACLVAAGTAVVALTVLLPSDLTAVEKLAKPLKNEIKLAKLVAAGSELTLEPDKLAYNDGEKPTFRLTVRNTTDKAVDCNVHVRMYSQAPTSFVSRSKPSHAAV